jgi:hypothetical protein
MIRGISNTTGTACHLSSALLILCHSMVPLRKALVHYSNTSAANAWFQQLGAFLDELSKNCDDDNDDAVDPTRFFQSLKKEIGIEANELGDAVTALLKILQSVKQIPSLEPLLQATVDAGRVHSVMTGRQVQKSGDGDSEICKRSKATKSRPMSCPFSLPGDRESIETALQAALAPQPLQGYQWTAGSFDETRVPVTNPSELIDLKHDEWHTTKTMQLDVVPNLWMVHLDRFHVRHDGQKVAIETSTCVSKSLELDGIQSPAQYKFELLGGILHVSDEDEDEDDDDEDEEGGHYVAILRQGEDWYLVDDAKSTELAEETALQLLSGHENTVTSRGSYMKGILLVYKKNVTDEGEDASTTTTDKILADFVDELAKSSIDWMRPEDIVGRRLRIKWAKGKFYPGTVASYNQETGKHQVRYADGDVKEYLLRQKTIEWQEDDA